MPAQARRRIMTSHVGRHLDGDFGGHSALRHRLFARVGARIAGTVRTGRPPAPSEGRSRQPRTDSRGRSPPPRGHRPRTWPEPQDRGTAVHTPRSPTTGAAASARSPAPPHVGPIRRRAQQTRRSDRLGVGPCRLARPTAGAADQIGRYWLHTDRRPHLGRLRGPRVRSEAPGTQRGRPRLGPVGFLGRPDPKSRWRSMSGPVSLIDGG